MKTVFSGIQPSGLVHLGNLLGAINNWVKLSNDESKNYFCIVDLHSLTAMPDKTSLKTSIRDTLKVLMASGINMKNSVIYVQSDLKRTRLFVLDPIKFLPGRRATKDDPI